MTAEQREGDPTTSDFAAPRSMRWLLYATLVVPLVVFPGFLFPFVTIRAVYFRVLIEIAIAILLYFVLRRELTVSFRRDFVFWALLAWTLANALAAAFGLAPMRSVFGDHERMGGVWFWIHLLAYYVLLRVFMRDEDWWRFMRGAVTIAIGIAGFGLVQDWFGPFDFVIGGMTSGVTVGNAGLLAPYLLVNVAFCAMLAVHGRARARAGYLLAAVLLVVALAFSGNRSSLIALFVGTGAGLALHTVRAGAVRSWRIAAMLGLFATAVALPFVTRAPWAQGVTARIPVLNKLSAGVDSSRVIQWRAAVDAIRERPLLGVGPENYQIIWSQYQQSEMHRFISDSRWDRAHNAYLDAFATAGIFGLVSLVAILVALIASTWKAARQHGPAGAGGSTASRSELVEATAFGFFVAYACYLIFWFFDLNASMLWIALAAFVATRATGAPLIQFGAAREKRRQSTVVLGVGAAALALVLYVHGFETLRMARTLNQARDPDRPLQEVLADYESVFGSVAPVTQHAFLMYGGRLRGLYSRFPEIRKDPEQARLFDRAFVLAITEFERQARQDPLNERVLVQHASVLMLGAYYYGKAPLYESALEKLERAVALSPRRVNTYLVLGLAYLNVQRPAEALRVFQRAYAVYPPLGRTHSYMAQAYSDLRKHDSAAVWLRSAVMHRFLPDTAFVRHVAQELAANGQPRLGGELVLIYLHRRLGLPFMWARGDSQQNHDHAQLAALAADLFAEAADLDRARSIRAVAPLLCFRPAPLLALAGRLSYVARTAGGEGCKEPWRPGDVS